MNYVWFMGINSTGSFSAGVFSQHGGVKTQQYAILGSDKTNDPTHHIK